MSSFMNDQIKRALPWDHLPSHLPAALTVREEPIVSLESSLSMLRRPVL